MQNWKAITSEKVIIDIVKSILKIDFENETVKTYVPSIPCFSQEKATISTEIATLLEKRFIVENEREPEDFISSLY